jgi:nucleoside phosphorylase
LTTNGINHGAAVIRGDVSGRTDLTARRPRRRGVDVLIVTAIPEEYDAVRAVGGRSAWSEHEVGGETPYATARFRTLSVALARPTWMGGRNTGPIATTLTDRLQPGCLAMCGVCAGNPASTAPGDVVVAAPAYEWDEGKYTPGMLKPDHEEFPLDSRWVRAVQDFVPVGLPSHGVATEEEARLWYLEKLYQGQNPRKHPARNSYFPGSTWAKRLARLESEDLIALRDGGSVLTESGRKYIQRVLYFEVDGPERLPFNVYAGPMASGSAVVTDDRIWAALEAGKRNVLAVDMESATIGTVAAHRRVPHWLVAKGVMDHADPGKDDRFKAFAAKASAEVLFALLEQLLATTPAPAPPSRVPDAVKQEIMRQLRYHWQDLADVFGVPSYEARKFRAGDEPHDLWAWIAHRQRLADLPDALDEIGRRDLAGLLRPYV